MSKTFNGQMLNDEAYETARRIEASTGTSFLGASFNIGLLKADFRRLYVATGGNRSTLANKATVGRDPTADEYRAIFNGALTGAAVLAFIMAETAKETGETVPEAKPVPAIMVADDTEDAKLKLLRDLLGGGQKIDPEAIRAMAEAAVASQMGEVMTSLAALVADQVAKQVRKIEVTVADLPKVVFDRTHKAFEEVLNFAANRQGVMLVGPAGSGKTTLAEQVAEALSLPFYMAGKTNDEVKIVGYRDGSGEYRDTAFRRAYENGGVFLFDEIDGWSPDALIAVNAPLAGKNGDFPDGMVKRHDDFVPIAAGNTFGRGADRQYVGRTQQDAAALDRFAVVTIDYDEELEMVIACDNDWTAYVQKVRAAVASEKVRHIVSPRASIGGGIMLKAGHPRDKVEESYIWKGMEEVTRNRVLAAMR